MIGETMKVSFKCEEDLSLFVGDVLAFELEGIEYTMRIDERIGDCVTGLLVKMQMAD